MSKDCILYLIRTSTEDLQMLNKSLRLIEENVLPSIKKESTDIVLFHENSFNEAYRDKVKQLRKGNIIFREIELNAPDYPEEIKNQIKKHFPHPTHGEGGIHGETYFNEHGEYHPGFSLGYRHMCDWFSGAMYKHPIMKDYEYYLRLDTDSFILSSIPYDLFEFMKNTSCEYAYIEDAVQFDNPKVADGLWKATEEWLLSTSKTSLRSFASLPEYRMFYTNIELAKTSIFLPGSKYDEYYEFINSTGNIFLKRWGDAVIKYLGVNLFVKNVFPLGRLPTGQKLPSFRYQHGAIYNV